MVQVHGNLGSRGHYGFFAPPLGETSSYALKSSPALGSQAEELTRSFLEHAFDPSLLAGMAAGGIAFQGLRRFTYLRAAARMESNALAEGLGYLGGFAAEVPAFVVTHKGINAFMGRPVDWSGAAWKQDLLHTGILLGSLKAVGAVPLSLGWKGPWGQGAAQLGMLGGTMGGNFMVAKLEEQANPDFMENMIHSLATVLQFNLGGRLIPRGVMGEWNYEDPMRLNLRNPKDALPRWILRHLKKYGQEAYPQLKTQLEAPGISYQRRVEIIKFFGDMDYQDAKPRIYQVFFDQANPQWVRDIAGEALLRLESPEILSRETENAEGKPTAPAEDPSRVEESNGPPLRNLVRLGPWNRRQRKNVQVFTSADFGNLPPPPPPSSSSKLSREGVFLGQLADGARAQLIPVSKAEPHPDTYRMVESGPDQILLESTVTPGGENPRQIRFQREFMGDFPFSEG
ncbi:MAG: hypothetical protein R3257_05470, partial [bacterium]|nr:hypothetical protein [bacterium]